LIDNSSIHQFQRRLAGGSIHYTEPLLLRRVCRAASLYIVGVLLSSKSLDFVCIFQHSRTIPSLSEVAVLLVRVRIRLLHRPRERRILLSFPLFGLIRAPGGLPDPSLACAA